MQNRSASIGDRPVRLLRNLLLPGRLGTRSDLEAVGKEYYEFRAALMIENDKGMTKTYNRFHDPRSTSPEIA